MPTRIIHFINAFSCSFEWKLISFYAVIKVFLFSNPYMYFLFMLITAACSKIVMWMVERYLPGSKLAKFLDKCTRYKKRKP